MYGVWMEFRGSGVVVEFSFDLEFIRVIKRFLCKGFEVGKVLNRG